MLPQKSSLRQSRARISLSFFLWICSVIAVVVLLTRERAYKHGHLNRSNKRTSCACVAIKCHPTLVQCRMGKHEHHSLAYLLIYLHTCRLTCARSRARVTLLSLLLVAFGITFDTCTRPVTSDINNRLGIFGGVSESTVGQV